MSRNRTIDDEIVLERATAVFWRRGYAATSMRDLSEATGLSAAALYHRFTDKDELIDISVTDPDRRGCLLVNTALDGAAISQARDLVRQRLGEVEAFFHAQLRRARDARRIEPEIDPGPAAEALLGTVLAIRVLARLDPERGRLRRLADSALASLIPKRKARFR